MPKTITLRLSDEIYEKFNRAAIEDKRSIANLIQALALRKLDEENLADDFEMQEIFSNAQLLKKLEKGHSDATMQKGRMLASLKGSHLHS
jgi:predicted CopG family antitoxin